MKRRSFVRKSFSFALSVIAVFLFVGSERVFAQSKTPKFEVGAQFSLIRFSDLEITEPGFGGRFTYNINKHVAVEAEVNLFPRDRQDSNDASKGGHKAQALFGIKAGTRGRRVGLFGKIRPGLVNFSNFNRAIEPCFQAHCPPLPASYNFSETDFA